MDVVLFDGGAVKQRRPCAVAEEERAAGAVTLVAPASVRSEKTSLVLFRVCSGDLLRRGEPIAGSRR
jgi:hypothetical protein